MLRCFLSVRSPPTFTISAILVRQYAKRHQKQPDPSLKALCSKLSSLLETKAVKKEGPQSTIETTTSNARKRAKPSKKKSFKEVVFDEPAHQQLHTGVEPTQLEAKVEEAIANDDVHAVTYYTSIIIKDYHSFPSIDTSVKIASFYCRRNQERSIAYFARELQKQPTLNCEALYKIIQYYARGGRIDKMEEIVEYIKKKGLTVADFNTNCDIITAYAKAGRIDDMEYTRNLLETTGNQQEESVLNGKLIAFAESKNFRAVKKTIEQIKRNKFTINANAYCEMIFAYGSTGDLVQVEKLIQEIDLEKSWFSDPLLEQESLPSNL